MIAWAILQAGGPVVVPLLLGSIATVTVAIDRAWFWAQVRRDRSQLVPAVFELYGRDAKAAIARFQQYADGLPIARISLAALELHRPHPIAFRLALSAATQAERPQLRRFDLWLQTVTALAPLLGLLGTVTGLMGAFAGLDWAGEGPSRVNAGLSEALVSTAIGLVVALLALTLGNLFRAYARREQMAITRDCRTLERLYLHHYWHFNAPDRPGYRRRRRDRRDRSSPAQL